jgi:hypothetical protein
MREILKFIKNKSIDLSEMGYNNFALSKKDALELLEKFKENNILLYGGDFLEKKEGRINYNYTNWSTDGKDIMYNLEYAKDFIKKYATNDMYVAFVTEIHLYNLLPNLEM